MNGADAPSSAPNGRGAPSSDGEDAPRRGRFDEAEEADDDAPARRRRPRNLRPLEVRACSLLVV